MEESVVVAAQEYPVEFYHLMHDGDGDGDSSSSRVHGEREGTNPRPFYIYVTDCLIFMLYVLTCDFYAFLPIHNILWELSNDTS